MLQDLERLIHLQRAESDLRRAEAELGDVPRRKADLDADLARERGRLDTARDSLGQSQKARRQHEAELQDLETKRSRYKTQLMDVKTNREYTAMLHEIETVEREIRGREDQILAEMERAETLTAEVQREEAAFKEAESRRQAEERVQEGRADVLKRDVQQLSAERDAVAATIEEDVLDLFRRVARRRGVAVAAARDGTCQLCHMKLRPQMYVDLKRNDQITQCPACSRILYFEPPVSVELPQP